MREEISEEEKSLELYPDKDGLHPARLVFSPGAGVRPPGPAMAGHPGRRAGLERTALGDVVFRHRR